MGWFDKFIKALGMRKVQVNILIVGLNNSGKSTIVSHFKNPDVTNMITVPTVGFSIEQFENQGVFFTAFDMSGGVRYRNLWEHQFKNCQGIIFVIDSSDKMRLVVVKEELELLLTHTDLTKRHVPILFFANKMDMPEALSSVKIAAGEKWLLLWSSEKYYSLNCLFQV